MRKFNEEDFKVMSKYEDDFKRAIDSRFAKGILQVEFDEIAKVYKETLNRQASSSCGGCVLQMLTSVGRLYFSYKKQVEAIQAVQVQSVDNQSFKENKGEEDEQENKTKSKNRKRRTGKKSDN